MDAPQSPIAQLVTLMARHLVDYPDEVSVTAIEGGHTLVLELKVAEADTGKVIGKHGRTAQAMRVILGAVSGKGKKNMILEILEPTRV
jgi:uncharacterized protein